MAETDKMGLESIVTGHDALEHGVAFLADVGDAGRRVVAGECRWQGERVNLERHSFDLEFVGDDLCDQFLFKLAYINKFYADTGVFKAVEGFAVQRQIILVRQLDLHSKFFTDIDILFPTRKTAADADLLKASLLLFAELQINDRGYVERESYVLSLIY